MNNEKPTSRTLLWSIIMSAPGPLIIGLGFLVGNSSTQLADFFRRSAELLGIIMAFIAFKITTKHTEWDQLKKERLEKGSNIFVGSMMILASIIMIILAIFNQNEDKGNVIPGLVVAFMGLIANTIFWIRYTNLNRNKSNPIIKVQARLYRAKSFVDACVSFALLSVLISPDSRFSYYIDMIGSLIVAVYLLWCGVKTVFERLIKNKEIV